SEKDSDAIARILVKEKLAACVNLIPIRSIYFWKGKIEEDKEYLLIIKTKTSVIDKLKKKLKEIHSYEVPELIVLPIEDGLPAYLNWLNETISES
ncbi:MAG: divalent-cation tolerance protein CutA, partial [Candidatus Helarchaeota archaeon]